MKIIVTRGTTLNVQGEVDDQGGIPTTIRLAPAVTTGAIQASWDPDTDTLTLNLLD